MKWVFFSKKLQSAWVAASVALLISLAPVAMAQLDADDRQALVDLYQATNGDQWFENEGWLGEPGSECNWHGIECLGGGEEFLLFLSGNNLVGALPASLTDADDLVLALMANNQITGTLQLADGDWPQALVIDFSDNKLQGFDLAVGAAPRLAELRLSGNQIEGGFPAGLQNRTALDRLDLSHNLISDSMPAWLADLSLGELNLADNQLSGSIIPALAAMEPALEQDSPSSTSGGTQLDLRANFFTGDVPLEIIDYEQTINGWLDLCWNPLEVNDPAVESWLGEEHAQGEFDYCFGKTIGDPPMTASGSWFDPERPGEGLSYMLLDDGQTLIHWFTYAPEDDLPRRQSWLVGNRQINHPGFDGLLLAGPQGGSFGQGLPNPQNYINDVFGDLVMAWTNEGRFESRQSLASVMTQVPVDQNLGLVQLSRLAGTTCDNQSPFQQYSGAWYNPDRTGEGFVVEVLPDDRAVVYWFTYQPDDSGLHAWMVGDGRIDSSENANEEAQVELTLFQTDGGVFGPQFDPTEVSLFEWGTLEIRFESSEMGQVQWDGPAEYGTGEYPLQRLAQPLLAECG